ncbi:hypothetical protein Tco_0920918 [Tanacetum coccineum]
MAYGLHNTKYHPVLEGFYDANWISNHNEGKFTSGYVFTLRVAAVSWKSSKQTVNNRSTMEAEFVALDKAFEEDERLRSFLEGIPLWPKLMTVVCIHFDSMAALTRAKNHIYNDKSCAGVVAFACVIEIGLLKTCLRWVRLPSICVIIGADGYANPVMTRCDGWLIAESRGGGTGVRVGRGERGRRPREGNVEHVDDLKGQGNDQDI